MSSENRISDSMDVPSSLFGVGRYRSYSPYQNNGFYLNPTTCSAMQYDSHMHAHQSHTAPTSHHSHHHHHHPPHHHPHHHAQQTISNTQYGTTSVHSAGQNTTGLDYFRAIQSYGYSAFSRDIESESRKDGLLESEKLTSEENNKSQSPNETVEGTLQTEPENSQTTLLLPTSNQSEALSDDVIEESFESDYDDEEQDSSQPSGEIDVKSNRILRPITIYISHTAVLHSSVPNNDWARAISDHFQRSFALSKANNENFFSQDDDPDNPSGTLGNENNDHSHVEGTLNESHGDSSTSASRNETKNVHSDKENESPAKHESGKNRPFQKRLEQRRRRQQKRLELLYTPFRKRKLPANFFEPPSSQQSSQQLTSGCYYSNPYPTYNAGSSSNYYNSTYNISSNVEQNNPQSTATEIEITPNSQYLSNSAFYEPSTFYDPLNGHSNSIEQASSVKVKTEIDSNQLANYSNSSNSSNSVNYSTKIRPTPLSLSVSMTIGGSGAGGNNNTESVNENGSFHHTHQNPSNSQQSLVGQTSSGTIIHPQTHHNRTHVTASTSTSASSSSSSSAAAAAAAALATLNNDLTLDMSIHISPLTLTNHTHHSQNQSVYGVNNSNHHQSTMTYPPSQQLCQQQTAQKAAPLQASISQSATNNLSGLFQESHTYYYHHQSSNSAHYQYSTKSSSDSANQCQQYSFGYYSANPNGTAVNTPNTNNQQSVIYPPDYSSMSRLHQQTSSIAPSSTSNVATAAHIFSSLYSLAGQAGDDN